MKLKINGEWVDDLPDALSVSALLTHLQLPVKKIAVERNLKIVPKSTFDTATLAEGDQLEIIHFIGGG
ncbi:sulfur carrier protein ThiS [Robiginitomaculum antarcticum]|uniref:sulfur carrier protein ThiS n=1 Tax=Robiginitomaculum antarcticum TaxID=437507 RepID=UPI0003A51D0A|nr:sulfur carrier protein ThiS [Robiginitomaculum antarcticum]